MRDPNLSDLAWFRPDGQEMTQQDWKVSTARCLGMVLVGDAINEEDERGNRISDATMFVLSNAHWEPIPFVMPPAKPGDKLHRSGGSWVLEFVTSDVNSSGKRELRLRPGKSYEIQSRSSAVFRFVAEEKEKTRSRQRH
jgi:glycogen operon protein